METLKERLRKKGWTEEEIEKTVDMLSGSGKKEKHKDIESNVHRTLYWSSLLVLSVCNIVMSIVFVPLFLFLRSLSLYLIIAALGLVFGLLFNLIIWDIEYLEKKHHLFAALFIPIIAILDIVIIVHFSNGLNNVLRLNLSQNPLPISLIYVGTFILPYLISFGKEKRKYKNA